MAGEGSALTRRGFLTAGVATGLVLVGPRISSARPSKPWHSATQKERRAYIIEVGLRDVETHGQHILV